MVDTLEHETEPLLPDPVKPRRLGSLPALPEGLNDVAGSYGCRLTGISIGKPIANVSVTLTFALDIPDFDVSLMGEHAYSLGFLGGWLGEGAIVKAAPTTADEENNVHQQLKVRLPRFLDGQVDQVLACIAPLLGGKKVIEPLINLDTPWRLNVTVDIEGELALYPLQQKFDLTTRAE